MAAATSAPPAPIASRASAPAVHVCESAPTMVCPGTSKRSRCAKWEMPFPDREKIAPYLAHID